jgi:branched-chain amino acid transport system substrate-binding protein
VSLDRKAANNRVWGLAFVVLFFIGTSCFSSVHAQIKLGLVVPLTGPLSNTGRDIVAATQALVAAVNKAGGIKSQQIELVIRDDGYSASTAEQEARFLVEKQNVSAILNCFGTVSCLAIAKVANETGTPLVGPISGAEVLRGDAHRFVFPVRPDATSETGKLLDYLKGLSITNVAVVYQQDGFGQGYKSSLEKSALTRGITSRFVALDTKNPDYTAAAKFVKDNQSASVIFLANALHSSATIKEIAKLKHSPIYLNLAGQANAGFVKAISGEKAIVAFATMTPSPNGLSPSAENFRRVMGAENLQAKQSYLSYEAFINTSLAIEVLKRSDEFDKSGFARAINNFRELDLGGGVRLSFKGNSPVRQGSRYLDLAVLNRDGQFQH